MDRIQQQLEHICELLDCILVELKCMTSRLEQNIAIENIRQRREQSLAHYRLAYQRQHGVCELREEGEDEID